MLIAFKKGENEQVLSFSCLVFVGKVQTVLGSFRSWLELYTYITHLAPPLSYAQFSLKVLDRNILPSYNLLTTMNCSKGTNMALYDVQTSDS